MFGGGIFGGSGSSAALTTAQENKLNALPTDWDNAITYSAGDQVAYNGKVYSALGATTGNNPSTSPAQWSEAGAGAVATVKIPGEWDNTTTYAANDLVIEGGKIYRAINGNTNSLPSANPANWEDTSQNTDTDKLIGEWNAATTYATNDLVIRNGTIYKALGASTGQDPELVPASWQADDFHSFRGNWTPTANDVWPTVADATVGQGALVVGNEFRIATATAFTFGGNTLSVGDTMRVTGPNPTAAGADWELIPLSAGTQTETLVLANLPADTWTSTANTQTPNSFIISLATGEIITGDIQTRIMANDLQLRSSIALTNIQIKIIG